MSFRLPIVSHRILVPQNANKERLLYRSINFILKIEANGRLALSIWSYFTDIYTDVLNIRFGFWYHFKNIYILFNGFSD